MTYTKEQIKQRIEQFVVALSDLINADFRNGEYPFEAFITVEYGTKNARIVRDQGGRSVHCFVELSTGNILKSASWKVPAKGVRGNIFDDNFSIGKGVSKYGAAYLRG